MCQLDLLDSALHAPQAGVGDEDFYSGFVEKAEVLVVRIARNHPLPDGNKRLAWQALTMFCALNDHEDLGVAFVARREQPSKSTDDQVTDGRGEVHRRQNVSTD